MNMDNSEEVREAADYFRCVLTDVLDELLEQVGYSYDMTSKYDQVKNSLRSITTLYKRGLSRPTSIFRSDWDDPANRCAYVFVYFMQHCHLVNFSLQQNLPEISRSWHNKNNLRVCSIGGGPGSDLVGLTRFLQDTDLFPPSLQCHVLDLFPNWKDTWDTIYNQLPETFQVSYHKCDLVETKKLRSGVLDFIREADIVTLIKSFSAVAAFFRNDQTQGSRLRSILRELKRGCFVLYIDNEYRDDGFLEKFALPAGLEIMFECCGKQSLPYGQYSNTIKNYCQNLDFSPMRSCDVNIRLFRKTGPVQSKVQSIVTPREALPTLVHWENRNFRPPAPQSSTLDYSRSERATAYVNRSVITNSNVQPPATQSSTSEHRPSRSERATAYVNRPVITNSNVQPPAQQLLTSDHRNGENEQSNVRNRGGWWSLVCCCRIK